MSRSTRPSRRRTRRAARGSRRACRCPPRPRTARRRRPGRSPPPLALRPPFPSPARAEKSTSASASSTSRFWSASSSDLRVTFSVASTVRSATSRADLLERAPGLGLDVLARRGDQLLALGLAVRGRLGDRRVGGLAGPGDDVVGLLAGLAQALAVLVEQLVGLLARCFSDASMFSRIALARFSSASPIRGNADLREHEHRHPEGEQRPDHQPECRARRGSCRPPPRSPAQLARRASLCPDGIHRRPRGRRRSGRR